MDDLFDSVLQSDDSSILKTSFSNPKSESAATGLPASSFGWRIVDWKALASKHQRSKLLAPTPSPVEQLVVRDRTIFIKRDDMLRLLNSRLSGNKARKLWTLNNILLSDNLNDDFPSCIVSYGGPQSNAMMALAAAVHASNQHSQKHLQQQQNSRQRRFVYYTKRLSRVLRKQPSGNLFRALSLGMELVELSIDEYNQLFGGGGSCTFSSNPPPGLPAPVPDDSLWIPQGGACEMALEGTQLLAQEIIDFWTERSQQHQIRSIANKTGGDTSLPLAVVVPGGTCTTALCLHRAIQNILLIKNDTSDVVHKLDVKVVVVPCVGDHLYARRQMLALNDEIGGPAGDIPAILPSVPPFTSSSEPLASASCKSQRYFRFGEPNKSVLDTFQEFKDNHQLVLDLLYGAPSWTILLRHWKSYCASSASMPISLFSSNKINQKTTIDSCAPINGRQIMYIHSGGLEGINTQLLRYKHKRLLGVEDVQMPGRSDLYESSFLLNEKDHGTDCIKT